LLLLKGALAKAHQKKPVSAATDISSAVDPMHIPNSNEDGEETGYKREESRD
jgi:hypothetical protein